MKYIENIEAQMKKGFLEMIILGILKEKELYSGEIIKLLKKSQLLVVEGTLYPILSRLNKSDFVDYSWKESKAGPPRKYYQITKSGLEALEKLKKSWAKLEKSINSLI